MIICVSNVTKLKKKEAKLPKLSKLSVSQSGTRSPIELFQTAKNHPDRSCCTLHCTFCHLYCARQKATGIPQFHNIIVIIIIAIIIIAIIIVIIIITIIIIAIIIVIIICVMVLYPLRTYYSPIYIYIIYMGKGATD